MIDITPFIKKTDPPYSYTYIDRENLSSYLKSFGFIVLPNTKRLEITLNNWRIWFSTKGWTKAYINPETKEYQNREWKGHDHSSLQDLLNEVYKKETELT